LYDVTLAVDLGMRLSLSAGYDKAPAKGQEQATRGTVSATGSASGKVYLNKSYRFDATQAQAYVDALKTGSGTQKEFAIIRCGLSKGWDAARDLYLGAGGQAMTVQEANQLKVGESTEVGKQTQVGGKAALGVKGGGFGVGVEGGHERGREESLKVTKEKDGTLRYDAKQGDSSKTSGGASVSAGVVEGSFGVSTSRTTSTGYSIAIDPNAKNAAEMQKALAACRSQAELDAFAKAYPAAVQEKTKSDGRADKQSVGVGIGSAKVGMNFGNSVDQTVVTDGAGNLKEKTVTGANEGGIELGVGNYKIGASSKEQATATVDGAGNAGLDVKRTDKSTDTAKWLEANVPFAGGAKNDGALTKAAGGGAPADTDSQDIKGIQLKGGDLQYLGHLACNEWNKWMAACRSPRELGDWAQAGRAIKAAGGSTAVVAEQLARFVGKDSSGRGHVIDSALRPSAGDMSGGARYEFPEGLAARKASYEASVIADAEAGITRLGASDPAKAAAKGQELVRELDSLYAAVSSAGGFTQPAVKAEMLSSITARKDKVLAALRVLGGGKADELSLKEKVDKYNALLSNCQRYKDSENDIFAKIEASFQGVFASSKGDVVGNVALVNQLRGMYTLWDKEYDEMAALAQENKLGAGIYWKYKPDKVRFERAYKGQAPGAASAAQPETEDKRKKAPPPAAPKDPLGDAHRELQKKREAGAQGIEGRLPAAKNKAHGAGNRLYAWIRHERKAAAVDAHNRGSAKLKSADNFAKKVKPGSVEDLEAYGHVAIEDYDAAAKIYAEGLALYPQGMPPK
jgi:hypothetical protein